MGLYEYEVARELERQDIPFHALIMAAMRRASSGNLEKLQAGWPDVWQELRARYHAPGGLLPGEQAPVEPVGEGPAADW